uniref:receptor protein-tyrosine kinase n=1 Tax=Culicoides sonorensis TaxID=179676 RepID=A0A336M798_CULSO
MFSQNSNKYEISGMTEQDSNTERPVGSRSLTIFNAQERDSGSYKCEVRDHNDNKNDHVYLVTVLDRTESVLEIDSHQTATTSQQNATVSLLFNFKSYPNATFEILKNGHRLIMDDRYDLNVMYKHQQVIFKMKDVHVDDTANYTLVADNGMKHMNRTVEVFVQAPPIVMLEPEEVYSKLGQKVILLCQSISYPPSNFEWSYRKCEVDEWDECARELPGAWPPLNPPATSKIRKSSFLTPTFTNTGLDSNQQPLGIKSQIEGNTTETTSRNVYTRTGNFTAHVRFAGVSRCIANNGIGVDIRSAKVMVGDLDRPVMLWRHNEPEIVAEGDEVRLECGAIKYNYTNIIQWKHGGKWIDYPLPAEMDIQVAETQYSHRSILVIKNVDQTNAGQYVCVTKGPNPAKKPDEVRYYLRVHQRKAARVIDSNLTAESITVSLGDHLDMYCDVDGVPPPEIMWTKDDELLKNNSYNILISKEGQRSFARIIAVKVEHEGQYKCTVTNKDGKDTQTSKLIIKNRPFKYLTEVTAGVLALILILIICTIFLCCRVKKEKDKVRALKKAGLANFEEGDIDRINPDLDLNEQADLLPYDRRFEFPRDKLKLGQQLGAGAFGVVIKGVAQGIVPYEDETTVAVKMVKANTDDEIMRALISELKIMVHLGQHLNVVNLLGAVTKNIARREVMVIVEYCRFGNVQKFLLKHRTYFVDQIKKDTDEIDSNITENEYRWSNNSVYNMSTSGRSSSNCGNGVRNLGVKYINLHFSNDYYNVITDRTSGGMGGFDPSGHINSKGYVRHSGFGVDSANTEATLISRGANAEYLKTNPDYLAMLGPPDHMAPQAPMATHEEFHVPDVEAPRIPGYVNMKPSQGTAIYTPGGGNLSDIEDNNEEDAATKSLTSNSKKTSPVQKPPRKSKERKLNDMKSNHQNAYDDDDDDNNDGPGENIPMLESIMNSLGEKYDEKMNETQYNDLMPRHPRDTVLANQYVNVPSATKNNSSNSKKPNDAFSNPSYVAVRNVNERT